MRFFLFLVAFFCGEFVGCFCVLSESGFTGFTNQEIKGMNAL